MFANLESFSIFFFISLAFIVLAIAFEDKLIALEKKYDKKRSRSHQVKRTAAHSSASSIKRVSGKKNSPEGFQPERKTRKNAA